MSFSPPAAPLTAATGEAFFADAMRRAVSAQQWEVARQLHALAQGCGAVTAVGPVGDGDGLVVASAGPSRRLDLYMYGGALAAARARGLAPEERALVEVRGFVCVWVSPLLGGCGGAAPETTYNPTWT